MTEIKKINKISLAKMTGLFYGLFGFLITLFIASSTILNIIWQNDFAGSVLMVTLFNLGAGLLLGILAAIISAIVGWLVGWLLALIYNYFAQKVGGVKIDTVEESKPASQKNLERENSSPANQKF